MHKIESIQQQYKDLLSLTLSMMVNDFDVNDSLSTDTLTYDYFAKYQKNTGNHTTIPQKQTLSTPPARPEFSEKINFKPVEKNHSKTITPPPSPTTPSPPETANKAAEPIHSASVYAKTKREFSFKIDPPLQPKETSFKSIKLEIQNLFPNLVIKDSIPDDLEAKKINQQWNKSAPPPEVILLTFHETPEQKDFLKKVTDAINDKLAPAVLISALMVTKENKWDNMFKIKGLKLIIAPDYGLYSTPHLMTYYREFQKTFGGIPILLLTDISLYFKQPHLKAALWQAICTRIKNCT